MPLIMSESFAMMNLFILNPPIKPYTEAWGGFKMNEFIMANDSDIMSGIVTDVYFEKTIKYRMQMTV